MTIILQYPELFLVPQHICCDDAEYYLLPPNRRGCFSDSIGINVEIFQNDFWRIDYGDGGYSSAVSFCPWCGAELEQIPEQSTTPGQLPIKGL